MNEVKANAVLIVKAQLVQLCKTQLKEFKAWQLNPQRTYLQHFGAFGASSIEVIEDSYDSTLGAIAEVRVACSDEPPRLMLQTQCTFTRFSPLLPTSSLAATPMYIQLVSILVFRLSFCYL